MAISERTPIRVVGRYALYNEIAAGGMATIHLGRLLGPVGFARTVAVKRLHPQFAKDPEFVSMFLDEARLAARVQHPNVVATIDVVASDGELFLIMDYVRGESLSKILRTERKKKKLVPPRIASAIICGFLHGLHSAHEAKNERGEPLGLVHRDVSPQNVLIGSDGIARVLDFGIAKAQGRIQVTRDGQIKGKLAYMPPEQLSGRELSRAADIYASAVVMWEMLTSERLFKGATERDTLSKILREPVPPPSSVLPSLPREFDAVLLKALSRDPSQRHATAKELALQLERCCGIASATAVGEWVDDAVGAALDAREEQIAEIESSSVNVPVDLDNSDSDVSFQDVDALRKAMEGTPPGGTRTDPPPEHTEIMIPTPAVEFPANLPPNAMAPPPSSQRYPSEPSYSGIHTGIGTGTGTGTMSLPIHRRLPVIAAAAGVAVLLVSVAVVLGGRYSSTASTTHSADETTSPSASATPTATAEPAMAFSASSPMAPASSEPTPAVSASPPDDSATSPKPSTAPSAPLAHPTTKSTTPAPTFVAPAREVKPSCDPPFVIDASGHKKYKRECM